MSDDPVLEQINETWYRINLLGEYQVSTIFNFSLLSPCDVGDEDNDELNLRIKSLQYGENDENQPYIKTKDSRAGSVILII